MVKRFSTKFALVSFVHPGIFYSLLAFAILYAMWPYFYHVKGETIIVLGAFSLWRYGWKMTHYIRSALYGFGYYPKLRRLALRRPKEEKYPRHIYFIIPSYNEEPWVTVESFGSILSNLGSVPCSATLVVATGSDRDDALFTSLLESHPVRHKVELVLQRQSRGKRYAMGHALRALSRRYDDDPNSVTILMDGDSHLEVDTLKRTIPFFSRFADLGALTTNEMAYIHTRSVWYKDWFNLKFGQRHILFQSYALSRKVLTLTGRFSMFRTRVVVEEQFIRRIEDDILTHWMHGKFRFLMGDDKSTWFHLLKDGWNMLYIPDVTCFSLESRDASFLKLSVSLPYRWYGNTMRNNARALKLGWRKTGFFIWLSILDQRLSMWTALVGITGAVILSLVKSYIYLPFYIAWVCSVRVLQIFVIAARGHPVSMLTIPLMLYNQWVGALIKIRASFHLADQNWSKGGASQKTDEGVAMIRHPLAPWMPNLTMSLSYGVFLVLLLLAEGAMSLPDVDYFAGRREATVLAAAQHGVTADDGADDALALQAMIDRQSPGRELILELPAGRIDLFRPLRLRGRMRVVGRGPERTRLVSHLKREHVAALQLHGSVGPIVGRLAVDARPSDRRLVLDGEEAIGAGELLLLEMPNDDRFLAELGSERWNREYPYLRQMLVEVVRAEGERIELARPVGLALSRGLTTVERVAPVSKVRLAGFSLRQVVPGAGPRPAPHAYENRHPAHAVDAVSLNWAAGITLEDLELRDSGRHALAFDGVYEATARRLRIDGAWNKGPGGHGYVRLARTYHSRFLDSEVRNLRHIALQWSSAFNTLAGLRSGVDINLHGGYTHDNRIREIGFDIPAEHPWKGVVSTPPDAHWAPPDGVNQVEPAA